MNNIVTTSEFLSFPILPKKKNGKTPKILKIRMHVQLGGFIAIIHNA